MNLKNMYPFSGLENRKVRLSSELPKSSEEGQLLREKLAREVNEYKNITSKLLRISNYKLRNGIVRNVLQSNLAIGLYLLPRNRRKDALRFYRFCHSIDECVDHSSLPKHEKESFLKTSLDSLEDIIQCYKLDRALLCEIIHGMQMDLVINRYATFEELYLYVWRVASAVGLISAQLFGGKGATIQNYAENLGVALQLTNILRDVAEDAAQNRIYLPLEDLTRFKVTEEELLQGFPSPQATHLFNYQAERALSYFAKADLAWDELSPGQRHLMRPARLMEAIYRTLLEKMQRDRYDLFHRRYRVSIWKKLSLAWHLFFFDH